MTLRPRYARTQRSRQGSVGSCGDAGVITRQRLSRAARSGGAIYSCQSLAPTEGRMRGVFCCTANVIDLRARHLFCLNVLNEFLSADE